MKKVTDIAIKSWIATRLIFFKSCRSWIIKSSLSSLTEKKITIVAWEEGKYLCGVNSDLEKTKSLKKLLDQYVVIGEYIFNYR